MSARGTRPSGSRAVPRARVIKVSPARRGLVPRARVIKVSPARRGARSSPSPSATLRCPRAPLDRHSRGGGHGVGGRSRGAAGPPPPQAPAPGGHGHRRRGAVRALRPVPALACARRRDLRPADVGLLRHLRDAQRRPGGAGAARARRLSRARRSLHRRRHDAHAAAAARPRARRRVPPLGEGARLVALALVPVPARHRRLPARAPPGAVRARGRPRVRDVRPRTHRLLGRPDRSALVCGQAGPHGRRAHARAAAHDGRVRGGVLGFRLGTAVRSPGRKPSRRHALAALRHVRHGRPPAGRDGSCRRRGRLGATPARSGSRSSTSASTTSWISPPGSRLAEGIRRAAPAVAPLVARVSAGMQALEARASA